MSTENYNAYNQDDRDYHADQAMNSEIMKLKKPLVNPYNNDSYKKQSKADHLNNDIYTNDNKDNTYDPYFYNALMTLDLLDEFKNDNDPNRRTLDEEKADEDEDELEEDSSDEDNTDQKDKSDI